MRRLSFLLLPLLLGWSCSKESESVIPADVLPYVERFFTEAQARGLDYRLEDYALNIRMEAIARPDVAGTCNLNSGFITIDEIYWRTATDREKERVVFHELGHCVLDRRHRNEKLLENDCISLMQGAENGFTCSTNDEDDAWWAYYYDELFDQGLGGPAWLGADTDYDLPPERTLQTVYEVVDSQTNRLWQVDYEPDSPDQDFEAVVRFTDWEPSEDLLYVRVGSKVLLHCRCNNFRIRISDFAEQTVFFWSLTPFFNGGDVNVTIRRINGFYYYFLGGRLIHQGEADNFLDQEFRAWRAGGNGPVRISLRVSEID
jgi:hypothetical protein